MFQIHRKAYTELLALLRVVSEEQLPLANVKGQATDATKRLLCVRRQEEQSMRRYERKADTIYITNETTAEVLTLPLDLWEEATAHAFELLRTAETEQIEVDDALEGFLDEAQIFSIAGTAEGQHHLLLELEGASEGVVAVWSRVGITPTMLLDGGRSANIKLEQTGTRFATPMAGKVNALESEQTIRDRMLLVESMGSSLRYNNVADRVFRANLALIDLHLGRLLCEMLRLHYGEGVTKVAELMAAMVESNPLKVSAELIEKHRYYEVKLQQLLMACVAGMRPAKIYRGETSLPPYVLLLASDATPVLFDTADRELLADFLLRNTRFVHGNTEKDKFGYLERENNVYYFKLNLRIGLTKR